MCGHFGYATTNPNVNTKKKFDIFTQGIYADALRGFDSTGVAAVFNNATKYPTPHILKRAVPAYDFIPSRAYAKLQKNAADYSAVIGHNRAATIGKIINEAAHPYQHGDITLAHNGTLNFDTGMEGNFETDSEEICYTLSRNPTVATLEKIRGAYALVWHDAANNTINFARNEEREFSFAISKDGKSLFWASESSMLHWILSRNNIDYETLWKTKPGKWFSFDLNATSFAYEDAEVTDFNPYVKPATSYGGYSGNVGHSQAQTADERLAKFKLKTNDMVAMIIKSNDIIQQGGSEKSGYTFKVTCDTALTHQVWLNGKQTAINARAVMYNLSAKAAGDLRKAISKANEEAKENNPDKAVIPNEAIVVYANPRTVYPMSTATPHSCQGKNYEFILDEATHWTLDSLTNCVKVGYDKVIYCEKKSGRGALVAVK